MAVVAVRDVIQFLIFRQLERDTAGQMKLESMFNYVEPIEACAGRHAMVLHACMCACLQPHPDVSG